MSVSEIELAKSKGVAALYASREDARRMRANWMAQPLWCRTGDIIFGTMFVAGLFLLRLIWVFPWSIRYVAVMCAGLLLPVLWFVPRRDRQRGNK
jgi:hypothetical protein